jgi:nitrite reductase/ring-hydroxylating ferredoxin subunit
LAGRYGPKAEWQLWSKREWEAAVHTALAVRPISTQVRHRSTYQPIQEPDIQQRVAPTACAHCGSSRPERWFSKADAMSAGLLAGTMIMSQCDRSQFDITTGVVLRGPVTAALATEEVREADGQIEGESDEDH